MQVAGVKATAAKPFSGLELASIIRLIRWGQPFVNPQLAFRLLPAPTRHRPA
jgi:hypothetical protein